MKYCTVQDVIDLTGVTADKMGIDEEETELNAEEIIDKWIEYASALIDDYTQNPITPKQLELEDSRIRIKKLVYEDVATRIVGNRIALREAYKNYAVLKIDDWSVGSIPSDIFTDNEKEDLSRFKEEETQEQSRIGIITVTGPKTLNHGELYHGIGSRFTKRNS